MRVIFMTIREMEGGLFYGRMGALTRESLKMGHNMGSALCLEHQV